MLIQEFSYLDPDLESVLEKKGFRYLRQGADQAAYLAPGGKVILKIFGAGFKYTPKKGGITRSQRMFMVWADFCQSRPNNPYLPRFLPGEGGQVWRPFDFKGRRYLQTWQEYLPKSDQQLNQYLALVDHAVDAGHGQIPPNIEISRVERNAIRTLRQRLGPKGFKLMVQTLAEIQELAARNGYVLDLHWDNFRSRADGTPVIMDPWTIG